MSQRLIILGTGGGAHDILDIVDAIAGRWTVAGFLDDSRPAGSMHFNFPILGGLADAARFSDCLFVNAIGSDRSYRGRAALLARTSIPADRYATLIHPLAAISPRASVGRGVVVGPGAVIGGAVAIGDQVTICPGVLIGHDSRIGSFSMIAPGACISGGVQIGQSSYLGARCSIRQNITIGANALVGMGAVVLNDVEPGAVVVGVPARCLEKAGSLGAKAMPEIVS